MPGPTRSMSAASRTQEIVRVLEEKHLIRLPVVDSEGKLVGIVARRDILQGYLKATTPVHGF